MDLKIKQSITRDELLKLLKDNFPKLKIQSPFLYKNLIVIQNGTIEARITINNKKGILNVKGGVNAQNFGVLIGIGIGFFMGVIGVFIFLGIFHLVKSDDIKKFEKEVGVFLEKIEEHNSPYNHLIN